MDGQRDVRRRRGEAVGYIPPGGSPRGRWRQVLDWLLPDREDIDQEGLLAERTLRIAPRRPNRERTDAPGGRGPGSEPDEARR